MSKNTTQNDKRTGAQPTVTIELDDECQHYQCSEPAEHAHIVTGTFGPSDVAGYCQRCSLVLGERQTHTEIGEVDSDV